MKIDSHHHFWDYSEEQYGWINDDMAVLKQDFGPAELLEQSESSGISGVVSVQARQSIEETSWLLSIAAESDLVKGVVGWVDLRSPIVRDEIEKWSGNSYLKGVRHVVQDEPDDAFILGTEFNSGVSLLKEFGLVYDILIFAKHLPNSIQFVDQHPEQNFVLDHIAKPTIRAAEFDSAWKANMIELAKRPNVSCKFSGVVTEVRDEAWDQDLLRPYWDVALEAFGAERLMYGSDWPVCLLRSGYSKWHETVHAFASDLSTSEQEAFWSRNAIKAYSLQ